MMIPREDILLDMDKVVNLLSQMADDVRRDGLMALCVWKEMEMTVYEQGKIMFFPLQERSQGITLATDVLEALSTAKLER